MSTAALILFVDELESLPIDDIRKALQRCRRELKAEYGQTLTLKDVLDRAGVIPPEQMQAAAADLAWASVMDCFYQCADCPEQHLSRSKQDKLMARGDARLEHAIRAVGGWRRLIETDPGYQGPLRKDFVSAYSTFDAANEVQMQQLKGFSGKLLENWNKMP